MKTNASRKTTRGFTLIEMVGVLAVIAVLAALLIPRIFAAINESRINNAAVGYNSVKSAAMMYFGKYGKFADKKGAAFTNALPILSWDTSVLLPEGLIEKPFTTKVGTASRVQIAAALTAADAVTGANAAYDLDGSGAAANDCSGCLYIVEAILEDVSLEDAKDLNLRIDGETTGLGPNAAGLDTGGRVKFDFTGGSTSDVHVYIAHK